jgi:hypothetical protein
MTMKRLWKFVLVLIVGLCLGAGVVETLHVIKDRKAKADTQNSDGAFQRRLQCKHLADDYVTRNSDDHTSLLLDRVDFSPTRHSCIVALSRTSSGHGITLYSYDTVDILTAETLFSGECDENEPNSRIFCGNGRDIQLMEKRDKTLEAALKSGN